jgi:hypothetical protein
MPEVPPAPRDGDSRQAIGRQQMLTQKKRAYVQAPKLPPLRAASLGKNPVLQRMLSVSAMG